jgi:hypothetical protein
MFVMHQINVDTPPEIVSRVASVLRAIRTRLKSRYAIVTARTGGVLTANLLVFELDDGSDWIRAFTSETQARAWLLADALSSPSPQAG